MSTLMEQQELQNAQVAFALVSRMVYEEPSEQWIESLLGKQLFENAPYGAENSSVCKGLEFFRLWEEEAQSQDFDVLVANLKSEWLMLIAGAGTPEAPSWQSYYSETNSQLFSKTTLDVRKWYKQYGLMLQNLNKEPDDHLGIMLGFMSHLMALEEEAHVEGKSEEAQGLKKAQEDFLVAHILPWLASWHYLLKTHARSDYYRGVAHLVFGFCEEYAKRFGIFFNQDQERFLYKTKKG